MVPDYWKGGGFVLKEAVFGKPKYDADWSVLYDYIYHSKDTVAFCSHRVIERINQIVYNKKNTLVTDEIIESIVEMLTYDSIKDCGLPFWMADIDLKKNDKGEYAYDRTTAQGKAKYNSYFRTKTEGTANIGNAQQYFEKI